MKIAVLGTGSKGNSTLITTEKSNILIDVGFSYKSIKEKLSSVGTLPKEIDYILITHEHTDHIYGLSTFLKYNKPTLCISKKIKDVLPEYDKTLYLEEENILNDVSLKVFRTSHDTIDSLGYLIENKGESIVFITDTGYINSKNFKYLKNKTYYIIESNHDIEKLLNGKYPYHLKQRIYGDSGHLSNESTAMYLNKFIGDNTKKIVLIHLSEENNEVDLAYNTVNKNIEKNIPILVSTQNEVLRVKND